MKFEIDTDAKTVKLLDSATVVELLALFEDVLADGGKEYRIIPNNSASSPRFVPVPYRMWPDRYVWQTPPVICSDGINIPNSTGTNWQ